MTDAIKFGWTQDHHVCRIWHWTTKEHSDLEMLSVVWLVPHHSSQKHFKQHCLELTSTMLTIIKSTLAPGPAWWKAPGSPRRGSWAEVAMATKAVVTSEPAVLWVRDSYFPHWYKVDVKRKPCEEHCILQHSNRICVITVAGFHPVLQSGKTIRSVSYQISKL